MIKKFVEKWNDKKEEIESQFRAQHPGEYGDIVRIVIEAISDGTYYPEPDPERIHIIDDGDYQGTLLFVIASKGYQPSEYWLVKVDYGSCSGCDTLENIREYGSDIPTKQQVNDYMTLALHIVQGLKQI